MAETSAIEWTDATWNPITGCSVLSAGCKYCYAMKLAGSRMKNHPSRAGLTVDTKAGPVWTGEVRFNEAWLNQPLLWKRPRDIFVCAHADLFHESVEDDWIDRIFEVMAAARQHRFQVLTKRSARMRHFVQRSGGLDLPNVLLGVSVEDNDNRHRLDDLVATSAVRRWVSAEPLLGPLDLTPFLDRIDWVVAGGESGPNARPMHPDWARNLRDQCASAGVPFLFKQWGEFLPEGQFDQTGFQWAPGKDGRVHWWSPEPAVGEPIEDGACSIRVGKKTAGRLLDNVLHDGMPA